MAGLRMAGRGFGASGIGSPARSISLQHRILIHWENELEGYFDTYVAPVLLGVGVGLVLIHVLGIQAVHPLLLVTTVPSMAVGAYGTSRHYLRKCGCIS